MADPVLPPLVTLPCPMCNDELVEKPEPPPKVLVLILNLGLNRIFILSLDSLVLGLFLDIVLGSSVETIFCLFRLLNSLILFFFSHPVENIFCLSRRRLAECV